MHVTSFGVVQKCGLERAKRFQLVPTLFMLRGEPPEPEDLRNVPGLHSERSTLNTLVLQFQSGLPMSRDNVSPPFSHLYNPPVTKSTVNLLLFFDVFFFVHFQFSIRGVPRPSVPNLEFYPQVPRNSLLFLQISLASDNKKPIQSTHFPFKHSTNNIP